MKINNKGITLSYLIIYIIALIITIGILSSISKNFYSNVGYIADKGKYVSEFNKFNMYFIEDVKKNSDLYEIKTDEIVFRDGTVYTYRAGEDKSLYRNKVKVCRNVELCEFTQSENRDGKKIINVRIYMGGDDLVQLSSDYVLKYW